MTLVYFHIGSGQGREISVNTAVDGRGRHFNIIVEREKKQQGEFSTI